MARRRSSEHAREEIIWNGIKFYRYPDSPNKGASTYFTAAPIRLHRAVWAQAHGPIPEGYHVHHIDGDPGNNDLSNLELVHNSKHIHKHLTEERLAALRAHMRSIQPLTKAWHKTPKGKAFHKAHGERVFGLREAREFTCQFCGGAFESRAYQSRFCSAKCRSADRRAKGVDNEQRACVECGVEFTTNRYTAQQTCSRPCGGKRASRKRARLQPDGSVNA